MKIKAVIFSVSFLCFFVAPFVYGDSSASNVVSDNAKTTNNGNNNVNVSDPQKPIVVKKNQPIFSIILQSNRTTGFSWSLKSYDTSLIKPVSSVYFPPKHGLMGAGGYEKWIFAVKPAGFVVPQTTSITLIYARPWDLQGAQATNFKVVTVQ